MLFIQDLRALRNDVRNLYSAVTILKDAISNCTGMVEFDNILDNINMLIDKIDHIEKIYKIISEDICETENWVQISLSLKDIKSLFIILKYSLKSKRTKVSFDDIFNCLNIIHKILQEILTQSIKLVKSYSDDNISQI